MKKVKNIFSWMFRGSSIIYVPYVAIMSSLWGFVEVNLLNANAWHVSVVLGTLFVIGWGFSILTMWSETRTDRKVSRRVSREIDDALYRR